MKLFTTRYAKAKAPVANRRWAVTYEEMRSVHPIRWSAFAVCAALAVPGLAQETLTLDQALRLARAKNGNLAAAQESVRAARARAKGAFAAFLPTVTPSLNYSDQNREQLTGFPKGSFISSGTTTDIEARFKLFDTGERDLAYRGARLSLDAETLNAIQTVRETLVDVYTQYFDALRAQELVKVSVAQVTRARLALAQTEAQIKVGEAAEKDRYQPEADALNAEVDRLSAEARRRSAEAALKATIGFDMSSALPVLERFEEPGALTMIVSDDELGAFRNEGLKSRADLNATRKRLQGQDLGVRLAKVNGGVKWSVDVAFTRTFGPDVINNRLLGVSASFPLFDGGRSRAEIAEAEASRDGSAFQLQQSERQVEAAIESAFYSHRLNFERVRAARSALNAARTNYEKVSKAQELGAQGTDVVAVSTAQVTLATAERNYVEAIYDFYISEVQLQLAIGRPIKGEEDVPPERVE
jgi:outer membrane protein